MPKCTYRVFIKVLYHLYMPKHALGPNKVVFGAVTLFKIGKWGESSMLNYSLLLSRNKLLKDISPARRI